MLVTGNGEVWSVEEDNDLWIVNLLDALDSIPDTVDDIAADRALDTICFLQDEDLYTPTDEAISSPWAIYAGDDLE